MASLYAIRTVGQPFVKLGHAKYPTKRLIELSTGCPFALSLYASCEVDNAQKAEYQLHQALHPWRVRGEWFEWNAYTEAAVEDWPRDGTVVQSRDFHGDTLRQLKSIHPRTPGQEHIEQLEQKISDLRAKNAALENQLRSAQGVTEEFALQLRQMAATMIAAVPEDLGRYERDGAFRIIQDAHDTVRAGMEMKKSAGYPHRQIREQL